MSNKHAIVFGANGLVGNEIVKNLVEDERYEKVTLLNRRNVEIEHEKITFEFMDFRDIHKSWDMIKCDDLFYCIGTTMNQARKKNEFFKIEHDYCINIAKIANHNKVKQFFYISSKGANSKSIFFYNKTKGQIEEDLIKIGFPALHIFRPWVLLGKRSEFRFFESLAKGFLRTFNFLMLGFLKEIKAMPATLLAKMMIATAIENKKGTHIYTNRMIHEYFKKR
jgi:uncharacterized protein YbjT (DUF2867 family)